MVIYRRFFFKYQLWFSSGDVAIIKEMIKYGINIDGKDNRGQTALHIAARFDQEAVAQLLIRNGANLEIEDYELQTPLYRAGLL